MYIKKIKDNLKKLSDILLTLKNEEEKHEVKKVIKELHFFITLIYLEKKLNDKRANEIIELIKLSNRIIRLFDER